MKLETLFFIASAIFAAFVLASVAFGLVSANIKETGLEIGLIVEWLGHSVYYIPFPG